MLLLLQKQQILINKKNRNILKIKEKDQRRKYTTIKKNN